MIGYKIFYKISQNILCAVPAGERLSLLFVESSSYEVFFETLKIIFKKTFFLEFSNQNSYPKNEKTLKVFNKGSHTISKLAMLLTLSNRGTIKWRQISSVIQINLWRYVCTTYLVNDLCLCSSLSNNRAAIFKALFY